MSPPLIPGRETIGVDPGGHWTGVVIRGGPTVRFVRIVTRTDGAKFPGSDYLNEVLDVVAEARAAAAGARLGVEGVVSPQWFIKGKAQPLAKEGLEGLMGGCMVFGSVLAAFPDAVVVAPGQNGSAPLQSYPRDIVGGPHQTNRAWRRAEPKGTGILRHARSAWDVAGAAGRTARAARAIAAS